MPTALIFGASRGLGRALAEEHLKRGWQVIATVRDGKALADIGSDALTVEIVDTTDWPAVDALRDRLAGRSLDLLFSAAIIGPHR
jgi:NAD(P)-dependent dehydrogenase (short-subunit alcohol dehydrogenase family)